MKASVYISSMEDFEARFGPSPLGQMYGRLIETNLPSRWHWLIDHPRLLSFAFLLRPSWQPDPNAYRMLATETAEVMERADAVSSSVFAEFGGSQSTYRKHL
jgi:hypothetical protein